MTQPFTFWSSLGARCRGLGVLWALGFLIWSGPSVAEPGASGADAATVEQARTRFNKGVQLFRDGNYEAALVEFERAYELAPSYRLLYNIAQVEYERHDYVSALEHFDRYLEEGASEIPKSRRQQVTAEMQQLQGLVGRVHLTSGISGAEVFVDDQSVGTTPLERSLRLNVGRRRITVTAPGHLPESRTLEIAGGDESTLHVELSARPSEASEQAALSPEREPDRGSGPSTAVWVGAMTTTAFALSTGVMGINAWKAKRDFDRELDSETTTQRVAQARNRVVRYAAVTDVLAVATLISGGITIYFAVVGDDAPERKKTAAQKATLGLSATLTQVRLEGSF
jgi:tetratricopeptide (TPR) repeat protein